MSVVGPGVNASAWASFLPNLAVQFLGTLAPNEGDGEAEAEVALGQNGMGSTFPAAAIFADASGFTALTEKLATLPDGAERMCSAINAFLTDMIDTVHKHGGDVVKFAGDAVSVVFPSGGDSEAMMRDAAVRATACAIELHQRVGGFVAWVDPADGVSYTLSLHIGVGVGTVTMLTLGGRSGRCELVFAGPPMIQSAAAEPRAQSNQTCLSPQAWALVADVAAGVEQPTDDGSAAKEQKK